MQNNFRTKDGRQVALTGCWRSSETWAQWTDVRAATDCKVPVRMKTMTRWKIWFWFKRTSPKLTAQSVKYHGRQPFLDHLLSASYESICSWNALRGDVHKSWLRWTVLLVSYLWKSFPSLPQTSSSLQIKRCSPWLQQRKNYENRLKFNWVKANKIKRVLRAQRNFHKNWTSNFLR